MADMNFQRGAFADVSEYLGGMPAVEGVVVASMDGEVVAGTTQRDPRREAALASFVASRAVELAAGDGDLRGFGRHLAGSTLLEVALGGRDGETVIVPASSGWMMLTLNPGAQRAAIVQEARTALRRIMAAAA